MNEGAPKPVQTRTDIVRDIIVRPRMEPTVLNTQVQTARIKSKERVESLCGLSKAVAIPLCPSISGAQKLDSIALCYSWLRFQNKIKLSYRSLSPLEPDGVIRSRIVHERTYYDVTHRAELWDTNNPAFIASAMCDDFVIDVEAHSMGSGQYTAPGSGEACTWLLLVMEEAEDSRGEVWMDYDVVAGGLGGYSVQNHQFRVHQGVFHTGTIVDTLKPEASAIDGVPTAGALTAYHFAGDDGLGVSAKAFNDFLKNSGGVARQVVKAANKPGSPTVSVKDRVLYALVDFGKSALNVVPGGSWLGLAAKAGSWLMDYLHPHTKSNPVEDPAHALYKKDFALFSGTITVTSVDSYSRNVSRMTSVPLIVEVPKKGQPAGYALELQPAHPSPRFLWSPGLSTVMASLLTEMAVQLVFKAIQATVANKKVVYAGLHALEWGTDRLRELLNESEKPVKPVLADVVPKGQDAETLGAEALIAMSGSPNTYHSEKIEFLAEDLDREEVVRPEAQLVHEAAHEAPPPDEEDLLERLRNLDPGNATRIITIPTKPTYQEAPKPKEWVFHDAPTNQQAFSYAVTKTVISGLVGALPVQGGINTDPKTVHGPITPVCVPGVGLLQHTNAIYNGKAEAVVTHLTAQGAGKSVDGTHNVPYFGPIEPVDPVYFSDHEMGFKPKGSTEEVRLRLAKAVLARLRAPPAVQGSFILCEAFSFGKNTFTSTAERGFFNKRCFFRASPGGILVFRSSTGSSICMSRSVVFVEDYTEWQKGANMDFFISHTGFADGGPTDVYVPNCPFSATFMMTRSRQAVADFIRPCIEVTNSVMKKWGHPTAPDNSELYGNDSTMGYWGPWSREMNRTMEQNPTFYDSDWLTNTYLPDLSGTGIILYEQMAKADPRRDPIGPALFPGWQYDYPVDKWPRLKNEPHKYVSSVYAAFDCLIPNGTALGYVSAGINPNEGVCDNKIFTHWQSIREPNSLILPRPTLQSGYASPMWGLSPGFVTEAGSTSIFDQLPVLKSLKGWLARPRDADPLMPAILLTPPYYEYANGCTTADPPGAVPQLVALEVHIPALTRGENRVEIVLGRRVGNLVEGEFVWKTLDEFNGKNPLFPDIVQDSKEEGAYGVTCLGAVQVSRWVLPFGYQIAVCVSGLHLGLQQVGLEGDFRDKYGTQTNTFKALALGFDPNSKLGGPRVPAGVNRRAYGVARGWTFIRSRTNYQALKRWARMNPWQTSSEAMGLAPEELDPELNKTLMDAAEPDPILGRGLRQRFASVSTPTYYNSTAGQVMPTNVPQASTASEQFNELCGDGAYQGKLYPSLKGPAYDLSVPYSLGTTFVEPQGAPEKTIGQYTHVSVPSTGATAPDDMV